MESAFDFKLKKLLRDINSEVVSKFSQYQKDGNTEDMFRYIYNLEEANGFLDFTLSSDCKDEQISNNLREEGNKIYKTKKLKEALEKYNECILSAPHPKLSCEKTDTNVYPSLSKGYANRSAVLFQLKEYENCICDIERSLTLCNSEITQLKLKERKIKCLIATEMYDEAEELVKSCRILLNTLKLEEDINESNKRILSKLLEQCTKRTKRCKYPYEKKNQYEEIMNADISSSLNCEDLIFAYNNPTPPSLDDEPNPTIPAFSCALKLQYSPDQGRYVVATRDIKPGEVIAVESAYASSVNPEEPNSPFSFCTFCLARCAVPLPCPECINVVFCSEECRNKGWNKFHMKECPVYSQLQALGIGFIEPYRIIAGQSLDELNVFVSQFKKDKERSPKKQILNEDQICDSDSYRGIYFLEGNIKNMDTQRLIGLSIKAFVMTKLLKQSNRFFDNIGNQNLPNEEDMIFIGSLFIHHILGVSSNSYGTKETHVLVNKKSFAKGEVSVGTGIFIAESLFNHSCIPSATVLFYGNVGVCRANQFIPSGNQVNVCYSDWYYNEPDRLIRRKHLSYAYSFTCNCNACVSNCKLSISDLKTDLSLFPKLRTNDKRFARNNLDRTASLKSEVCTLMKRFELMTMELRSPRCYIKKYLEFVLEIMEFFDRFVVIPDTRYIQLTMILREIFERESSCYIINQTVTRISNNTSDLPEPRPQTSMVGSDPNFLSNFETTYQPLLDLFRDASLRSRGIDPDTFFDSFVSQTSDSDTDS